MARLTRGLRDLGKESKRLIERAEELDLTWPYY
jgi:hypothetical protein